MTFSASRFTRRSTDGSIAKGRDVIAQLGVAIGIPELSLEDGSCTLSIDGVMVSLELDAPHNRLVVSSFIGETDGSDGGRLYRSLLEGSLRGIVDATGMVFAVDGQSRVVMAAALFLDDLDGAELSEALSDFVARAEEWRAKLNAAAASAVVPVGPFAAGLMA